MSSFLFEQTVIDVDALRDYIRASLPTVIQTTCDQGSGVTRVAFTNELSAEDESALTALMVAYTNPAPVELFTIVPTGIANVKVNSSSWYTVWDRIPSNNMEVERFEIKVSVSPQEAGAATGTYGGSARIVNVSNNTVVAVFADFDNLQPASYFVDVDESFMHDSSLELQVKTTGVAAQVVVHSSNIYYS